MCHYHTLVSLCSATFLLHSSYHMFQHTFPLGPLNPYLARHVLTGSKAEWKPGFKQETTRVLLNHLVTCMFSPCYNVTICNDRKTLSPLVTSQLTSKSPVLLILMAHHCPKVISLLYFTCSFRKKVTVMKKRTAMKESTEKST
jgi:hypothetical protein